MNNVIWLSLVLMAILLWSSSGLLCKVGARDGKEPHICLKYAICAGTVFGVIALVYLMERDEPFTIWESAIRYWPMTVFGIVYAIICPITFQGYLYNEATVESPVEAISGGTSTILLILVYLALGRVDSISRLLTPLRTAGIIVILVNVAFLATVRNRSLWENAREQTAGWMKRGLGTLIFPVLFSAMDGLETIVTGVCLDTTYGYGMPEGDSIIIVGMEYALFALGYWIYVWWKEGRPYNPFCRHSAPLILASLTDNLGIVCYSYAMAINSVSTDPLLAVYPILVMIGGRIFMKEKVSTAQYIFLLGIIAGSVMVIVGTVS